MSDKHTDAQGELSIEQIVEVGDKSEFTDPDSGNAQFDRLGFARGVIAADRALRATEGQAQTSAAAIFPPELPKFMPDVYFPSERALWDHAVLTGWRAAQLADSTAPGAPVKVDRDAISRKVLAMPDEMPHCVGPQWAGCTIPPPGWYCTRQPGHEEPCAAWPGDAPTAQQSLTAGGAVPGGFTLDTMTILNIATAFPSLVKTLNLGEVIGFAQAVSETTVSRFAAAPLPQVQREALDATGKDGV